MSLAGVDCRWRAEADRSEADRFEADRFEADLSELDCSEPEGPESGRSEPGRSDDSLRPDCSLILCHRFLIPCDHGLDSARDFRPLRAVVMMVFSARRFSSPIIGTLVPTVSS